LLDVLTLLFFKQNEMTNLFIKIMASPSIVGLEVQKGRNSSKEIVKRIYRLNY